MADKTRQIINLSKANRVFDVSGGLDKDGKQISVKILPNQKAFAVPEEEAVKLLAKLPNGQPKYPELIDAATFKAPQEDSKALADALADNKKLTAENADLKAKLDKANGGKK